MKSISLLIFFLALLSVTIHAQTDTVVSGVSYNYISRYQNGKIKELGNYKSKGKIKHGQWTCYNINGQITEQGKYSRGKKNGKWFDGKDQQIYKHGKYMGTITWELPRE